MALLISHPSGYGVPATYWRILTMQDNYDGPKTSVTIVGYASEAARASGDLPLVYVSTALAIRDAVAVDATRSAAYAALKALESIPGSALGESPFAQAEDV